MPERYSVQSKSRIRGLKQYKDLSDEEFDKIWLDKTVGVELTKDFERRIQSKVDDFSVDYDLDDLKMNDKLTLRALAQAFIQLEDLERYSFNNRIEGIEESQILLMEKLSNIMSSLRKDISKMQDDLKITRKIRKGDREETVVNYLEDLKRKAKEFYRSRMNYIWCPNCKMLLGTVWFLYPEEKNNKIQLVCNRVLETGEKCNTKVLINSVELMERRGVNIDDVPEFFK